MQKNFLVDKILYINIILALIICVLDVFYINFGTLLLKANTSALFVVLGVINFVYLLLNRQKDIKFPIFMLLGLIFAMLGDILLNINFIVGAVFFAIGHIFFFTSYCFLERFKWLDIIAGLCIFVVAGAFIIFAPIFTFENSSLKILCLVYALIISRMLGKSIVNFAYAKNLPNLIIMLGSILFVFSDIMLLLYVFADLGQIFDILCISTYYPAEILLAMSIWINFKYKNKFLGNKNDKK